MGGRSDLPGELDKAKEKFMSLREKYRQLKIEHRENEHLLMDMKAAMFNLRVGQQVMDMDAYDVQPIRETITNLCARKNELEQLIQRVDGMHISTLFGRSFLFVLSFVFFCLLLSLWDLSDSHLQCAASS